MDDAILKLMQWRQASEGRRWTIKQGNFGDTWLFMTDEQKADPRQSYYIGQMAPTAQCCDYIASEVAAAIKAMEEREIR